MNKLNLNILADAILLKLYIHAAESGGPVSYDELQALFQVSVTSTFLKIAMERISEREHADLNLGRPKPIEIRGIGIEYVQKQMSDPKSHIAQLQSTGDEWLDSDLQDIEENENEDSDSESEKSWEPLPIDRNSPEYTEAVSKTEDALAVIEGDNGFATSFPEMRDHVVWSLGAGVNALKEGLVTQKQVDSLLITPLKWIATKFAEGLMKVAANKAIIAILAWLKSAI